MTKRTYPLNEYGYVTTWLVSGRLDTVVDPSTRTIVNQWEYEWNQKCTVHNDDMKEPPENIADGLPGINDYLPWHLHYTGADSFVNLSHFYSTIYRCEFWCATVIVSPCDREVTADIWNFPSYDAWLNGTHVSVNKQCLYLPMTRNRVTLSLKKGENLFFLRAQNACTRDTHNTVALRFPDDPDIRLTYPDKEGSDVFIKRDACDWLYEIKWDGKGFVAPREAPSGARVTVNGREVSGRAFAFGSSREASIKIEICGSVYERKIEIAERFVPNPPKGLASPEDVRADFLNSIASLRVAPEKAVPQHFLSVYARLCKGTPLDETDVKIIRLCLNETAEQKDCCDFRFSYVLAAVKKGFLPPELVEEIKETALNFSYWCDEQSIGAMCFNSENHSLLFHGCQLIAGSLWPNEIFLRSGRTGREQEKIARDRINAWIIKIEKDGLSEFLSGTYSSITVAALLLAVDFADDDLSARASRLIDGIFYDFAYNTFDGVVYAPQGRIYRGAITPWRESSQVLSYFATGNGGPTGLDDPGSFLAPFTDTRYTFPTDINERLHQKGMHYGKAEGTVVQTYKGESFMLTSLPLEYVNGNCFGRYMPGRIGFQQHLSYATLGGICFVYANHPGITVDASYLRPGYWFGNGFFPAQKQWDNLLGQVFPLCESHPVPFTHLYFPINTFDSWEQDGNWLFGKRGKGYIGVWCSNKLSLFNDDIRQCCDFRAECGAAAYFTVCGDTELCGSFEDFKKYARDFAPEFDKDALILTTAKGQKIGGEYAPDDVKYKITF